MITVVQWLFRETEVQGFTDRVDMASKMYFMSSSVNFDVFLCVCYI